MSDRMPGTVKVKWFSAPKEYGFIGQILEDESSKPFLKTYSITDISWNKATRDFYLENIENGLEFHNLKTLFDYTIKTGKPVISNDPRNHEQAGGLPPGHPALDAYLGVPILYGEKLVGMFGIANRKAGYSERILKQLLADRRGALNYLTGGDLVGQFWGKNLYGHETQP